ncbi:hypothetical protein GCK32_019214 [Trichostrongylus colubriformis]|uniref:PABS domain-containing protein n=1 Tax=Trichostrongylus colubriformis TaxID=6319 RepID=A0AAN8IKH1_TRICO
MFSGEQYDVVLLDACTTKENTKFLCPVDIFITSTAVGLLANVIEPKGAIIVNLLSIEHNVHVVSEELKSDFEKAFRNCVMKRAPNVNMVSI